VLERADAQHEIDRARRDRAQLLGVVDRERQTLGVRRGAQARARDVDHGRCEIDARAARDLGRQGEQVVARAASHVQDHVGRAQARVDPHQTEPVRQQALGVAVLFGVAGGAAIEERAQVVAPAHRRGRDPARPSTKLGLGQQQVSGYPRGRFVSTVDRKAALARALTSFAAWIVLDLVLDARFPAHQSLGAFLMPSLDATVLLVAIALAARARRRLPRAVVALVAVLAVAVRLFRVGDGITHRYFNRPISLALDLPATSEIGRLLAATAGQGAALAVLAAALVALVGIGLATAWAVRAAERALAHRGPRRLLAGLVALAAIGAAIAPARASVAPQLLRELAFLANLGRYWRDETARIQAGAAALRARPHDLGKLGGADVFIFFVESYGATLIDEPDQAARMEPVYSAVGAALERSGFAVASGLLDSPTYAGRSWLAHETLATGVAVTDRIDDEIVQRDRPPTIARLFRQAGYRTVFAQPANRYRSITRWSYDFDAVYSGWDLDYHGPSFGWANMPDQYVLDTIRHRELGPAHPPLLLAYALVSSHAPWSDQPRFVADWSRIGDGSVYATLPAEHHPIGWTNLGDGAEAYMHSVAYDLTVTGDYLARFVAGGALAIVLGDHQPVAEVTRMSPSRAVPVHVISRNRALVDRFRSRGYLAGMRPVRRAGPVPGMETLLGDLLGAVSGQ
jgi:hypothetical protein